MKRFSLAQIKIVDPEPVDFLIWDISIIISF